MFVDIMISVLSGSARASQAAMREQTQAESVTPVRSITSERSRRVGRRRRGEQVKGRLREVKMAAGRSGDEVRGAVRLHHATTNYRCREDAATRCSTGAAKKRRQWQQQCGGARGAA